MYYIPVFLRESLSVYVQSNIICPAMELTSGNFYHLPKVTLSFVSRWLNVDPKEELTYIGLNVAGRM